MGGRPASDEEVAAHLGLSVDKVQFADRTSSVTTVSMEAGISSKKKSDAAGTTLQALISDKKPQPSHNTERAMMRDDLNRILDKTLADASHVLKEYLECETMHMEF